MHAAAVEMKVVASWWEQRLVPRQFPLFTTGRLIAQLVKVEMTTTLSINAIADTGTAGSIALLLQAACLPALVKALIYPRPKLPTKPAVKIELRGGTNATGAPQIDYITDVFAPFVNSYLHQHVSGANSNDDSSNKSCTEPLLDIQIIKRGYFPKGGGIVHVNLRPPSSLVDDSNPIILSPIQLTKCQPLASITIKAFHAGNCPRWVAEKMASGAVKELKRAWKENSRFYKRFLNVAEVSNEKGNVSMDVKISHETNCIGSGSGILIVACPNNDDRQVLPCPALGSSGLGNRKVPPIQTGSDAAKELIESIASGGIVDRWLQDQIIPFMALADGTKQSEVLTGELTLHTQTAMKMAEQMTGCKFEVERLGCDVNCDDSGDRKDYGEIGLISGRHIIRCQGIGFSYRA